MRNLILMALCLCAVLCLETPAAADPLVVTKSATVISDPVGTAITPRSIPGALVDYKLLCQNPLANALKTVKAIVVEDMLAPNVILRVRDIAVAGKGPVEFNDGSVLVAGLAASGLAYNFVSLANASDGIEFYNGSVWTYTPVADADGFDANVRGIRVTTTATFSAGTQFQLRYRVKIR